MLWLWLAHHKPGQKNLSEQEGGKIEKGWKYLTVACRRALQNVVWGGQSWAEGQHRSSATETQEALRERTKGRAGASGGMNNQIQLLSGAVY